MSRPEQSRQRPQQRGFPGSVGTEQDQNFAGLCHQG